MNQVAEKLHRPPRPRTNRPHGAGTIERTSSGRWRFRLSGPDGKRRTSPTFTTREEAQRLLDAATFELAGAGLAPTGPVTLGGYAETWLERRSVRSAEDERRLWRGHVAGTWLAAMPLVDIKRRHVRDFVDQVAQKKKLVAKPGGQRGERVESDECLSGQTVKLVFALLRRVLNEAIVDEHVQVNPAQGHRLPKTVAVDADLEEKWTFLTAEEIDQLLGCPAVPARARLAYEVAIFTGLRQGELWGLRWGDLTLDAEHPECVVRRSYEGPTKGAKVRRFPLLPRAADALRRARERAADTSPEALVFPAPHGGCYSEGHDAGWARRNRQKAGIREEVVFHSFRHSTASHLVMGTWGRKWTLAEVQSYLGHSSIDVTQRYTHLAPGHLHELASATGSGYIAGTLPGQKGAVVAPSPSLRASDPGLFLNSRSRVRVAPRSP